MSPLAKPNSASKAIIVVAILVIFPLSVWGVAKNAAQDTSRAIAVQAYAQDVRSWSEKLGGCIRGTRNYRLNREGWRTAQVARERASQAASSPAERRFNSAAADGYSLIVEGFNPLAETDCLRAFPVPMVPDGVQSSPTIPERIAQARRELADNAALERRIRAASDPSR